MLRGTIFLAVLAAAIAAPESRIINGQAASLYSHPHIASLQMDYSVQYGPGYGWGHICGGSIIDQSWILTAAHCVDVAVASSLRIEVGALNLYDDALSAQYEQTVAVAEVIVHSGWVANAGGMPNDIALLRLVSPLTLNNNVQLAKMADGSYDFEDTMCVLAGWGAIATGDNAQSASHLKEVEIIKISSSECNYLWGYRTYFNSNRNVINDKHICVHDPTPPAGDRPSACMGDSGGPMMCGENLEYLVGVTSWGESTCSGALPTVYTRVSAYLIWISSNTGLNF